jgi:hypothetical protein
VAGLLEHVGDAGQILPCFCNDEPLSGTFSEWRQSPWRRTRCWIPANPPTVCLFGQVFLPGGVGVFRVNEPRPGLSLFSP